MDALAKLGIDGWGILLYLINFGVLLILMQRFVYKPLVKFLDERRNRIREDVEQANLMREQLIQERAKEAKERQDRLNDLDDRVKDAKKIAREEAKRLLADAGTQRDSILAQATETANQTIEKTIAGAENEILQRIQAVAMHVLQDTVSETTVRKSVQDSWKTISKSKAS